MITLEFQFDDKRDRLLGPVPRHNKTMAPLPQHLQPVVEALCHDGCRTVRQHITAIEQGQELPQMQHLNHTEASQVLLELKTIMAVYDRCTN